MSRTFVRSALLLALGALPVGAQSRTTGYHTAARLSAALDSIAKAKPQLVQLSTLASSPGGRPVQLVRIGSSDEKPALLLLANAYGPQIVSSEVALRVIRDLATKAGSDPEISKLLATNTIYLVPRLNPDAAEAFFAPVRAERAGNDAKEDDDKDGKFDEDGPDDLNGDGQITMMRVKDPRGEWIADKVDPTLMRRADVTKGEVGEYRLLTEGLDDDGDGLFNEDGPGGTDISRNFANDYPWFTPGAGVHQFSAEESRAIAELVVQRLNIAAVYVLGMQDNLLTPWVGRRVPGISGNPQGTSAGGPLTAILPEDTPWFAEIARRFKGTTPADGVKSADEKGDPLSWAYYHMGRFAVGSRVWWPGKAPADTTAARKAPSPDPLADERNALRWLKANNPSAVVEWTAVPGKTLDGLPIEVGGVNPTAMLNPPGTELDALAAKQSAFVVELTRMLPAVALAGPVKVESLGDRVWRLTAIVTNSGYLPSNAAIGVRSRLPRRVKVELTTSTGQQISGGRGVQFIDALNGSGTTRTIEWVVVGAAGSTLTLNVGAPNAGSDRQTITLRAR